jgi:hypothetical protein
MLSDTDDPRRRTQVQNTQTKDKAVISGSDVDMIVNRAHGLRSQAIADTINALFGRRHRK